MSFVIELFSGSENGQNGKNVQHHTPKTFHSPLATKHKRTPIPLA